MKSDNGSATFDDGIVTFAAEGDGTRVTVLARQQFALPPALEAARLDLAPEVREAIVGREYLSYFEATLTNFEARYEGRDVRIGRPAAGPRAGPAPPASVERLRGGLASAGRAAAVAWRSATGAPVLLGPVEVDEHGFRHFRPSPDDAGSRGRRDRALRRGIRAAAAAGAAGARAARELGAAVCAGCEVVFHAAAAFAYWGFADGALHDLAVDGTRHVLEAAAAAGARRVVVTSSSVVLGSSTRAFPRDERDELPDEEPAPAYYRAKAAQARAAFERGRALGLDVVAALPTITVGPHDWKLVPSNAVLVNYLGDPLRTTIEGGCNVVGVDDVARAHLLAAERGAPYARYVAGSENLEWGLLHRMVAELAGVPPPIVRARRTGSLLGAAAMELAARFTGRPPAFTIAQSRTVGRFYWYRHDRLAALGWTPRPGREALARALAWLVASPHVSRALRATLRPSAEVYAARRDGDERRAPARDLMA